MSAMDIRLKEETIVWALVAPFIRGHPGASIIFQRFSVAPTALTIEEGRQLEPQNRLKRVKNG
jgi:hypothetical protein